MAFTVDTNPLASLADETANVELRGYSYEERWRILGALECAMAACGCWMLEQRTVSSTQSTLRFEVQLRVVFDLYGELVAAGVELTRESHARLTELCTVRGHEQGRMRRRRVVTVRLEMSFLEDGGGFGPAAMGLA